MNENDSRILEQGDQDPALILLEMLSEKLSLAVEEITPDKNVYELGADSLDIVELVMEAEETFGVEISDEEAERLPQTVGEIISYARAFLRNVELENTPVQNRF